MANYAHAKEIIAANVYTNHDGQVTAEKAKTAINEVVDTLIAGGYLYAGIAKLTPTQTNPGSPDANVFYIATEPGTYTNFVGAGGSLAVADGEVAVLKYNGSWSKEVTGAATAAKVTELGQEIDAVCDYLNKVNTDSLTLQEGAINTASPAAWNKDGFNRYHKAFSIDSSIRKIELKANDNISARVIFTNTYNVVAGAVISSLPNNDSISINAGEKMILDVPNGANYFIFNVNNNSADQTPEYIVLVDEDKDYIPAKSGIENHQLYPIVGQLNSSGEIVSSANTYRVSDFIKVPSGYGVLCVGVGGTGALLFGVYSSPDTSSFIAADSKYFKGTSVTTTEMYVNDSANDRYLLISTRLDSITKSRFVVDNTSVVAYLYKINVKSQDKLSLTNATIDGILDSDTDESLDSNAISNLPVHNGTLRGTDPCTWNLDGNVRYHKVVEIPANSTSFILKAHPVNVTGFILLDSYAEPTEDNESMDCSTGFEKAIWLPAGTKQEYEIPIGAKYIVFNEQTNLNNYAPEYVVFRHAYNRRDVDLSDYENANGALNAVSPATWTLDAFNRYHKAIPIPAWVKRILIKANDNVLTRYILVNSYTAPTSNQEAVANTSWGYTDSVVIATGESSIIEKPENATYLLVNVQSNQSGDMTPKAVAFDEQNDAASSGSLKKISVVTCNPGNYVGIGYARGSAELLRQYRLALSQGSPDLLCVQADTEYVDDGNTQTDQVAIFDNYKFYKYINGGAYNDMRIMSNFVIKNERRINYTGITGTHYHPFFYVAELVLDNRIIGVATVHFEWYDVATRRLQIAQVIAFMSAYDSIIVAGDMNPSDRVNGEHPDPEDIKCLYAEDNAIWSAAGYSIANGGRLGVFTTNLETPAPGETFPDPMPYDNIYVKGGYIMESKRLIADYMNDHAYVQADIAI